MFENNPGIYPRVVQPVKEVAERRLFWYNGEEVREMYEKEVDGRREVAITDIEALVPENHLVRKIEKVMDYEWIYERVAPYYSAAKNVRPGTDPVVLVKMVLLQHLFGIPSLRQTYQRACDTISYRWFLGYGLLDKLPHFATVSYAFCRRFPEELAEQSAEQPYGGQQHDIHRRDAYQGQRKQKEIPEGTGGESGAGICEASAGRSE